MAEIREVIARAVGEVYDGCADPIDTPNNWARATSATDAALAAIKQAGFVVVSRGDLERVVGLLRATDALQENGFADDAVNIVRAMIEASNAPT